jgi:hypothetical protein
MCVSVVVLLERVLLQLWVLLRVVITLLAGILTTPFLLLLVLLDHRHMLHRLQVLPLSTIMRHLLWNGLWRRGKALWTQPTIVALHSAVCTRASRLWRLSHFTSLLLVALELPRFILVRRGRNVDQSFSVISVVRQLLLWLWLCVWQRQRV